MSGICAVWRKRAAERTRQTLVSVCTGLSLDGNDLIKSVNDENAGVGVCARFPTQQIFQSPEILIACEAELYNEPEIGRIVGDVPASSPEAETAARLAGLYERFGTGFLEKL